jgi:cytochrome c oxidase assembly protein subunit 15
MLPRLTAEFVAAKPFSGAFTPKFFSTTTRAAFSQSTWTRNTNAPTFNANVFEQAEAPASETEPVTKSKSSSFPKTSHKSVAYWLLGSAVSVYGIVIFGGLTRLTESGYVTIHLTLSIEHTTN